MAVTVPDGDFESCTVCGNDQYRNKIPMWAATSGTGDTDAAYVGWNNGQGHGGSDKYLAMWSASAYVDDTTQTITGLANGTYELAFWAKGATTGINAFSLNAKDYSSNAADVLTQSATITSSDNYVQFKLSNIPVTSGKLTIDIHADCVAQAWIDADDVTLFRVQ